MQYAMTTTFQGAGQLPGLQVWRVEEMSPMPLPEEQYGVFYTGDSYLILQTKGDNEQPLAHDVHFWLGSETSQDEAGAAAIFATELDNALQGKAKQYRQVQGAESNEFLELFRGGIHYRSGGVKSGFHHVEQEETPPPALLRVKGKLHARVIEVPMSMDSLNSGDMFILDLFHKLYLWAGKDAHVQEKGKAREVLNALKATRKGKCEVSVVDEGEDSETATEFYTSLGVDNPGAVSIKPATADDAAEDGQSFSTPHLYKVSDSGTNGSVEITEVNQTPLKKSHLDSNAVFVLAAGGWIFVWHGKQASSPERKASLSTAHQILTQLALPHNTPVQLVKDGHEDLAFREYFEWPLLNSPDKSAGKKSIKEDVPSPGIQSKTSSVRSVDVNAIGDAPSHAAAQSPRSAPAGAPSPSSSPPLTPAAEAPTKPAAASTAQESSATPAAKNSDASGSLRADGVPEATTPSISTPARKESSISSKTADKENSEDGPQTNGMVKPALLKKASFQNGSNFVPKPIVNEPALPPKPVHNIKFQPGKDVLAYDELKAMRADSGVDMTRKEDYLSSEEFQKVFGKTEDEFKALPKWRQLQAKKTVGLF